MVPPPLQSFLYYVEIPNELIKDSITNSFSENPAYRAWIQQDQWMLSWLHSTISSSVMTRILGCTHASQLWQRIQDHFLKLICARARQLRSELRATTLDDQSVDDYLQRIKHLVDSLASVKDSIPSQQHINVILEGLPHDYGPVISIIESKFEDIQLGEVEALLIAHEMRMSKFDKLIKLDSASINLTQAKSFLGSIPLPSPPGLSSQANLDVHTDLVDLTSSSHIPSYSSGFRGNGFRNGRGRGRGCFGNTKCQVCFKFGHLASMCYHRFDQQYQVSITHDFQGYAWGPYGLSSQGGAPPYGYTNPWIRPQFPSPIRPQANLQPNAMLANSFPSFNNAWFPDSGASLHVTNSSQNIQQQVPFEGPDQIFIGNGKGLKILG